MGRYYPGARRPNELAQSTRRTRKRGHFGPDFDRALVVDQLERSSFLPRAKNALTQSFTVSWGTFPAGRQRICDFKGGFCAASKNVSGKPVSPFSILALLHPFIPRRGNLYLFLCRQKWHFFATEKKASTLHQRHFRMPLACTKFFILYS